MGNRNLAGAEGVANWKWERHLAELAGRVTIRVIAVTAGKRGLYRMTSVYLKHMKRRAGFTLIETIVTVGLIAVLAAFVIPTVIQKAGAADPVKVLNDVNAIRTGLEGFDNDTKVLPNSIWQLTSKPSTLNHEIDSISATATGTALTAGEVSLWNGPYVAITIDSTPTGTLATGFGAHISNLLERYDVVSNRGEIMGGSTGAVFNANNTLMVAIRIDGLTLMQAQALNQSIDGQTDPDVSAGPDIGANITGRLRWDKPTPAGVVTAYYLGMVAR